MSARIEQSETGWRLVSGNGQVLLDGLSNAQAWRHFDLMQSEPMSRSEMRQELRDKKEPEKTEEKQAFYSGLLQIARDKRYSSGWAWHMFLEKYGHRPDGLEKTMAKPSKAVWGYVNRKAISGKKP